MEAIKIELLNELVEMCKKSQDLMGTGIVLIPTPTGFEVYEAGIDELRVVVNYHARQKIEKQEKDSAELGNILKSQAKATEAFIEQEARRARGLIPEIVIPEYKPRTSMRTRGIVGSLIEKPYCQCEHPIPSEYIGSDHFRHFNCLGCGCQINNSQFEKSSSVPWNKSADSLKTLDEKLFQEIRDVLCKVAEKKAGRHVHMAKIQPVHDIGCWSFHYRGKYEIGRLYTTYIEDRFRVDYQFVANLAQWPEEAYE